MHSVHHNPCFKPSKSPIRQIFRIFNHKPPYPFDLGHSKNLQHPSKWPKVINRSIFVNIIRRYGGGRAITSLQGPYMRSYWNGGVCFYKGDEGTRRGGAGANGSAVVLQGRLYYYYPLHIALWGKETLVFTL